MTAILGVESNGLNVVDDYNDDYFDGLGSYNSTLLNEYSAYYKVYLYDSTTGNYKLIFGGSWDTSKPDDEPLKYILDTTLDIIMRDDYENGLAEAKGTDSYTAFQTNSSTSTADLVSDIQNY